MLNELWKKISGFWNKPGVEVSYSRINAFQLCPWKYKLMYRDGNRVPPNPFISLGLSVHRALEDFHRRQGTSLDQLMDSYDAVWVNEGFQSPQQTHDFYEKGRRMLENYHKSSSGVDTQIVHLEKEFSCKLGPHSMRGLIDRIDRLPDGTWEVIDYKTHNEVWKQEKADADLQMSLYAYACEHVLGFKPGLLSYYFLAHGVKVSTKRSPAQISAALAAVNTAAERIQKDDFPPNTAHCPKCDFKKICVHYKRPTKD